MESSDDYRAGGTVFFADILRRLFVDGLMSPRVRITSPTSFRSPYPVLNIPKRHLHPIGLHRPSTVGLTSSAAISSTNALPAPVMDNVSIELSDVELLMVLEDLERTDPSSTISSESTAGTTATANGTSDHSITTLHLSQSSPASSHRAHSAASASSSFSPQLSTAPTAPVINADAEFLEWPHVDGVDYDDILDSTLAFLWTWHQGVKKFAMENNIDRERLFLSDQTIFLLVTMINGFKFFVTNFFTRHPAKFLMPIRITGSALELLFCEIRQCMHSRGQELDARAYTSILSGLTVDHKGASIAQSSYSNDLSKEEQAALRQHSAGSGLQPVSQRKIRKQLKEHHAVPDRPRLKLGFQNGDDDKENHQFEQVMTTAASNSQPTATGKQSRTAKTASQLVKPSPIFSLR